MFSSNCETQRKICTYLGSNILLFCYVDILGNQVWSRCFITMIQFFKKTICPYTQPAVFSLGLRSMKMYFNIFPDQHNTKLKYHQSAVVSFREKQTPSPLKLTEGNLHEQQYNIPLETAQNAYESIPRTIQSGSLHINREMCIFHNCSHYLVHPLYVTNYNQSQT